MRKLWGILVFVCLSVGISGIYWLAKNKNLAEKTEIPHLKNQLPEYFLPIVCTEFSGGKQPIISIQAEELIFPAEIDLGFRGILSMSSEILQQLIFKVPIKPTTKWGFRGKSHQVNRYKIPKIKIGKCNLSNIIAQENNLEFLTNAHIPEKGQEPHPDLTSRIGWKAFELTNLFLDLGNSKIALCDGLSTLRKQGILIEKFIKTPLFLDRGLVECFFQVNHQRLRCCLDTGSTFNVWNTPSNEEIFLNPNELFEVASFQIEGQELGPLAFLPLPIQLPIHIDVTLGMDFFLKHKVFIDFSTQQVYFAPGSSHE